MGGRFSRSNAPSSPWEGTSGFQERPLAADYVPLTEVGFEFPFKKALLARYNPDAQIPAAAQAALRQNEELMRHIWSEAALKPVSLEPFSEEESKAVASGNFCNYHGGAGGGSGKKHHGGGQQGGSGRRFNRQSYPQAAPDESHHSFSSNEPALQPWNPPSSTKVDFEPLEPASSGSNNDFESYQRRRPDFLLQDDRPKGKSLMSNMRRRELEAENTVDKILEERFNAPLNAKKNVPPKDVKYDPKVVASLSDLDDDHDLAAWADSVDHTIGTFNNRGKYVETIPSAHQYSMAPTVVASSSYQQTPSAPKQVPIVSSPPSAATPLGGFFSQFLSNSTKPTTTTISTIITNETRWLYRDPSGQVQGPFLNAKMLDWYKKSFFPETLPLRREDDFDFEPLSAWKSKFNGKAPFEMAPAPEPTPASPITKLFDLNLAIPSPVQSAAQQPTSPSTKALNAEEQRFLSQFGLFRSGNNGGEKKSVEAISEQLESSLKIEPQKPAWGQVKPVQPVKLDDKPPASKLAQAPAQEQTYRQPEPIVQSKPLVPASSAGWVKPASPQSTRPLEEILREEEQLAAAQKPIKTGPKSFADLMKSTSSAAANNQTLRPVQPAATSSIPQPYQQQQPPPPKPTVNKSSPVLDQTKSWAMSALSPLSSIFDVETCVSLLMDIPTSDETASFVRANMRTDKVNMPAFLHELVSRRFGPVEASRFPPASSSSATSMTDEFVTVDRRKAKK